MSYGWWWWSHKREVDDLRISVDAVRWQDRHHGDQPPDILRWMHDMDRLLQAIDARRAYAHARRVRPTSGVER